MHSIKSLVFCLFLLSNSLQAEEQKENETVFFGKFDYGFISVFHHSSQWGKMGTNFSYDHKGGQDILLPTWRLEGGAIFGQNHKISFLYQPIFITTEFTLEDDLKVDDYLFEKGASLSATYDFPFYRFSYWYRVAASQYFDFWLGGSLQLRNANISFKELSGDKKLFRTGNVGPVPIFNLAADIKTGSAFSTYLAASGFWAPIKYLNGGSTDINGWIYEFEIQPMLEITKSLKTFLNFRILGGGAIGTSKSNRPSGGAFSSDILLTGSFTLGIQKSF